MIKLNRYVYIHFATIVLFAVCYFTKNLEILIISYGSVFLHELAHMISAKLIGLKISHIVLYPFGANLKLKNSIVYSVCDEIILYASGPLLNAVLALIFARFIEKNSLFQLIYWNNLVLFLFNLLPIIPMDGGIILKKILSYKLGLRLSEVIMKIISVILIGLMVVFEIILIRISSFNFSIVFICVFLIGNLFTNREKYFISYIKEIMYYKKKDNFKIKKVRMMLIKNDAEIKDVAKHFSQGTSYVILREDSKGKISQILTEREIIEDILAG